MAIPIKFVFAGNPEARLVDIERNFNPDTGHEELFIYSGPKDAIQTVYDQASTQGFTVSFRRKRGPLWTCVVQNGGTFVADRWERMTEWAMISIWQSPAVQALAGTVATLVTWRTQVEAALGSADPDTSAIDANADLRRMYDYAGRGMEVFKVKRYVLRLRRAMHADNVDAATPANALERVYTTAQLVSGLAIPGYVSSKLPTAPASVISDCAWGWMERAHDVGWVSSKNVAEEVREWEFAAWPLLFYSFQ